MLDELDTVKALVYDSNDEDTSVQAMYTADSCPLIPSTSKVRLPPTLSGMKLARTWL